MVITPALTADVDDWAPTGGGVADVWRLNPDAANRTIRGIAGGTDGRLLVLWNASTSTRRVLLSSENVFSTAADRLLLTGTAQFYLHDGEGILLRYDTGISRWVNVTPVTNDSIVVTTALLIDTNPSLPAFGEFARQDHNHQVVTYNAAPPDATTAGAAGTATTAPSRGDHTHGGGVPAGAISIWSTTVAPTGWALCDGSSLLRAGTFAALFAVIGTTYGSVDGTHFSVPDLRGRVPVGIKAGETEWDNLNDSGGERTHALITAELASHSHSHNHGGNTGNPDTQSMEQGANRALPAAGSTLADTATHHHTISTDATATGSGTAHQNEQPFLALNYIIKT